MAFHFKDAFKKFEEDANDLLIPDDISDEYSEKDIEACKDIYKSYMEILKISKGLYKKNVYTISFLLMYVLITIHHGPKEVDDMLKFMINYYLEKENEENTEYINCYDDDGNKLKIEDLDKL